MKIYIGQFQFNTETDQEAIRQKVASLPSISFKKLMPSPSELKDLDFLEKAKDFSKRVSKVENKDEKIKLLNDSFVYYKKFIKSNKSQISQKTMRDVALDAVYAGADMLDLLSDEPKKEVLLRAIEKIQVIAGYSDAAESKSLTQIVDALSIPQNHFAVTSEPLGTTHVKDCVFLVIRDRETQLTYAAHIDFRSDANSIFESILKYLPEGKPLDSYIIGGTPPKKTGSIVPDSYFRNISKTSQVLNDLTEAGYAFDTRYCILEENTPHNIVYDPSSGLFIEAVPGKELESYPSRELLVHLEDVENRELLPFFTASLEKETEHSMSLTPLMQKNLNKMLDDEGKRNKPKVIKVLKEEFPFSLLIYERTKATLDAYSKAIEELCSSVKLLSPNHSDVLIKKTVMEVLEKNKKHSLCIFPYSREKNSGLINKVVKKLQKESK